MHKEVTIKAPGWVVEDDMIGLLQQDLQLKLAYYESQCRRFEQHYKKTFAEFDAALKASRKENFQEWEDFMDWEAADSARQEVKQRLNELASWKT